ncbi:Heat-labile enterotoxin IIA, B chain [Escherichia coli]|uniref:Heat-labile enterotoxin IIA, B chain n=1 Tax=Escherichia coli TaxID=562 RepID=UPI000BA5D569|nr:Heat-labile enterotoxin IIA, B chain [Escherichia coli]PAL39898.1 Heat-labile enterotoxin IIA, B chain [Escherichia coli]PAL44766.1 Heat-labile enterotoxin IIA, B chain [Escherichia coli]HAL0808133.1 Heat-labile enterotoxin IIA, B chain [Escherichia coli]
MNSTKIISVIVLITGVLSGYAYAGVSEKFKSICNQTTANIVAGVQLKKYIADVNTNTRGIYVVSNTGGVWYIPGGRDYPDNILASEIRRIAVAAILSDAKVNLCAKTSSSPNHIWAIELDRES